MIQTATKYKAAKGARFFISTHNGHRIVKGKVKKADSNSTTISPHKKITEVPEGIIPEDATIEEARSVLAGMVLEGDLEDSEMEALLDVYQKWDDLPIGECVNPYDLLVYSGTLYKVVQGHNKQADWTPDITAALYTRAVPDTVISVWVQPTGAHDAYAVDDLVQWPEGGTVWRSTINGNATEPGTLLPWGYWVEAE